MLDEIDISFILDNNYVYYFLVRFYRIVYILYMYLIFIMYIYIFRIINIL